MERRLTAQRVWDDIQFELMQGLPSRDELGQSIRAVQKHQDLLRTQVFGEAGRVGDPREVVARQFQINEMLLTLLQETATALRKVQLDVERISRTPQEGPPVERPATSAAQQADERPIEDADSSKPLSDVAVGMRPEALDVPQHGTRTMLPLVGGTITHIKHALHRLVHFYIRLLSEKQAAVNWTYGEWILYQLRRSDRQADQLVRLGRRLAALETQAAANPSERPQPR